MKFELFNKVKIKSLGVTGFIVDIGEGYDGDTVYLIEETHKDDESDLHFGIKEEDLILIEK